MKKFDATAYEYKPRKYPRCAIRPDWVKHLESSGVELDLDNIWRQAGRHFADSLDPKVLGSTVTTRQLSTEPWVAKIPTRCSGSRGRSVTAPSTFPFPVK